MSKGKILVVRGGAIGDFILTLPVLSALRLQFPEAHLEVLGYQHIAQLAHAGGLVDGVRSIDARPMALFFARKADLDFDLSTYFAGFSIIISYLYDPDRIFKDNVARISKADFIQGPHRPDEAADIHAAQLFLKPLERLAIFDADHKPRLELRNGARLPADPPVLAMHPGSGSEMKNWPEYAWRELMERLVASTSIKLLLVGGEAEGEKLERLAKRVPADRIQLASRLPLAELAQRLDQSNAFIGHDSGISHLAAALGLPGIVLWAATKEVIWRPPSPNVRIIRGGSSLSQLEPRDVEQQLRNLLGF